MREKGCYVVRGSALIWSDRQSEGEDSRSYNINTHLSSSTTLFASASKSRSLNWFSSISRSPRALFSSAIRSESSRGATDTRSASSGSASPTVAEQVAYILGSETSGGSTYASPRSASSSSTGTSNSTSQLAAGILGTSSGSGSYPNRSVGSSGTGPLGAGGSSLRLSRARSDWSEPEITTRNRTLSSESERPEVTSTRDGLRGSVPPSDEDPLRGTPASTSTFASSNPASRGSFVVNAAEDSVTSTSARSLSTSNTTGSTSLSTHSASNTGDCANDATYHGATASTTSNNSSGQGAFCDEELDILPHARSLSLFDPGVEMAVWPQLKALLPRLLIVGFAVSLLAAPVRWLRLRMLATEVLATEDGLFLNGSSGCDVVNSHVGAILSGVQSVHPLSCPPLDNAFSCPPLPIAAPCERRSWGEKGRVVDHLDNTIQDNYKGGTPGSLNSISSSMLSSWSLFVSADTASPVSNEVLGYEQWLSSLGNYFYSAFLAVGFSCIDFLDFWHSLAVNRINRTLVAGFASGLHSFLSSFFDEAAVVGFFTLLLADERNEQIMSSSQI